MIKRRRDLSPIRLLLAAVWSNLLQLIEGIDSELTMKIKPSSASILAKTSHCHSAVSGISFSQTRLRASALPSASPSFRAKSLCLREYEMKTCGTVPHP